MRVLLLNEKGELGSVWDLIPGCPQPVSRLPWTWGPEAPIIGVWVWRRGLVSGLFEYYRFTQILFPLSTPSHCPSLLQKTYL